MSDRLAVHVSTAPTGQIPMKFYVGELLQKSVEEPQMWLKSETLLEDTSMF